EDPVHWDETNGFWLLTRYADVRAASKDPELFSSQAKGPWHTFDVHFSMQALDGPEHRRQRGIASKGFTPRMVRRLRETAHATIHACIDAVEADGGCEFVSALASPVPLRLIADMLGLPADHFDLFQRWSDGTASSDLKLRSSPGFAADQARLELLPRAVDEILRWSSPVRVLRRVATRDTELRGKKLREGESALLIYRSANRDEEVFDDPSAFRVDRSPNEHLTFGIGPHYCLGA